MNENKVIISPDLQRTFDALEQASPRTLAAGINRTEVGIRQEGVRLTSEKYNLSQPTLRKYFFLKRASSSDLSGIVTLKVRAIPIEEFGPRVEMREVSLKSRSGRPFTRKLPFVLVQRLRGEAPQVVPGAFPLHQRTTGKLRRGETIRRRIGKDRGRLTRIRYYNFPNEWLASLVPRLVAFGGTRLRVELDAAYRTVTGRLKRN